MGRVRRFRLTWSLGALILVLYGLGLPVAFEIGTPGDGLSIFALLTAVLGLVIARRQPGNSVAWLLLGLGAVLAFYEDAANYAILDYHFHHGRLPLGPAAAVVASELWSTPFLTLPLVILLFPGAGLPSRWRLVLRAYLAVCALITAFYLAGGAWEVSQAPIVVNGKGQLVSNPGPPGVPLLAFVILLGAIPVFWVSFVLRQALSWRRAAGERRAQLKWLMAGGVAAVVGLAFTVLLSSYGGPLGALDNVMLGFGLFSLPVCIVFAILKYRLDAIRDDLAGAVHHALEPAHVTLWLSRDASHPASPVRR